MYDYIYRLQKAMDRNNVVYKGELEQALLRHTGLKAKPGSLTNCLGSSNDTVQDCPVNRNLDKKEFIVIAHNAASLPLKSFVRVLLPSQKYRAQTWSKSQMKFVDVDVDILE